MGADHVIRQSRISLLDYNQGGKYLVGAVRFEHAGNHRTLGTSLWTNANNEMMRQMYAKTGINPTQTAEDLVKDSLEALVGVLGAYLPNFCPNTTSSDLQSVLRHCLACQ